jgi:hypothetical protein
MSGIACSFQSGEGLVRKFLVVSSSAESQLGAEG